MVFMTAFPHFFTPLFIMSELSDLTIQVTPREQTGRQACSKLRSAGRIPAVLYGKEFNQSYSLDDREMRTLLRKASGTTSLLRLLGEKGEDELVLIKEMQTDSSRIRFCTLISSKSHVGRICRPRYPSYSRE